jgi:preprotein translocase subunit YajC
MDSSYFTIIYLVVIIAVFYFLLIRPERKRKKQAEEMRSSLKVGDEITTIGGIIGTIVELNEDTLVIETSEDRVRVQFARWAISTVGKQTTAQQ